MTWTHYFGHPVQPFVGLLNPRVAELDALARISISPLDASSVGNRVPTVTCKPKPAVQSALTGGFGASLTGRLLQ